MIHFKFGRIHRCNGVWCNRCVLQFVARQVAVNTKTLSAASLTQHVQTVVRQLDTKHIHKMINCQDFPACSLCRPIPICSYSIAGIARSNPSGSMDVCLLFGAFAKLWISALSCLSVCPFFRPHGTTRLSLDGFWWNLVLELFSSTCWENSSFIKIWEK